MPIPLDEIRYESMRYPDESPFWPCLLFLTADEIVAVLYFDHMQSDGFTYDAHGVVDRDNPVRVESPGWTLCILSQRRPDADDPRHMAYVTTVYGDEVTRDDAFTRALQDVSENGCVRGLSYEASRDDLEWRPHDGWPAIPRVAIPPGSVPPL